VVSLRSRAIKKGGDVPICSALSSVNLIQSKWYLKLSYARKKSIHQKSSHQPCIPARFTHQIWHKSQQIILLSFPAPSQIHSGFFLPLLVAVAEEVFSFIDLARVPTVFERVLVPAILMAKRCNGVKRQQATALSEPTVT
jgi:hypothetical protein